MWAAAPSTARSVDARMQKKEELQRYLDLLGVPSSWQEKNDEELRNAFVDYALCSGLGQAKENGTHQRLKDLLMQLKNWSGDSTIGHTFTVDEQKVHWLRATHLKQLIHQHERPGNISGWLKEYVEGPEQPNIDYVSSFVHCGDCWTRAHEDTAPNYLAWVFCDNLCESSPDLAAEFFDSEVFDMLLRRVEMEGIDEDDCSEHAKERADATIMRALEDLQQSNIITCRQRKQLDKFINDFFHPEGRILTPRTSTTVCCGSTPDNFSRTWSATSDFVDRLRIVDQPTVAAEFPRIPPFKKHRKLASVIAQLDPKSWLDPSKSPDSKLEILVKQCPDGENHALSLAVGQIVIHLAAAEKQSGDMIEIHHRPTFCAAAGEHLGRFPCDADEQGSSGKSSPSSGRRRAPSTVILKKKNGLFAGLAPFFPSGKSVNFADSPSTCSTRTPAIICVGAPYDAKDILERLADFSSSGEPKLIASEQETRCALFTLKLAMYLLQAPSCAVGIGRKLTDTPRSFCDWLCFLSSRDSQNDLLGNYFALGRSVLDKYRMGSGYRELGQEINSQSHIVDQADWNRLYKSVEFVDAGTS